jgi:hypothetical protein
MAHRIKDIGLEHIETLRHAAHEGSVDSDSDESLSGGSSLDDLDPKWDSAELGRFAGSRVYSKSDDAVVEHFGPTQH